MILISIIEFTFQKGEFFVSENNGGKLLGIGLDTIVTTLLTILIFFLGIIAKHLYENHKENKRIDQLEAFVLGLIRDLKDPLERQSSSFESFIQLLSKRQNVDLDMNIDVNVNSKYINQVDASDLYKIFISRRDGDLNEKLEIFRVIRTYIDYVEQLIPTVSKQYFDLKDRIEKSHTKWNDNIEVIGRFNDNLIIEIKQKKIPEHEDEFAYSIIKCIKQWQDKTPEEGILKTDYYFVYDNLILPLKELCANNSSDNRISLILPSIMNCISIVKTIDYLRDRHKKSLENKREQIGKVIKKMEDSINKFEQIKKKNCLKNS